MEASPPRTGSHLLETLLREHRADLLAFVRRRAGHLLEPEDVLQQAAVRALAAIEQLRDAHRGRAWLFRIVRNVLADELRSIGLPVAQPLEGERANAGEVPRDTCRCALDLARTLKPEYREILERVVLQDVPVTTLAADLGVTPNNAVVRLHRARRALRSLLEQHCGSTSARSCLSCLCQDRGCCAV